MAFILPCFSVCFRGNHIRLYQIEAVLARQQDTYPAAVPYWQLATDM